jgi:hypothetical protein
VIGRLRAFVHRQVGAYLQAPGDGRRAPAIPAATLLWSLLVGYLLREGAFHAVEALVRSRARRGLGVRHPFGDDTLAYFTERLAIRPLRTALAQLIRAAKRRKAFDDVWRIGLVLDGTPFASVVGQQHKLSLRALVRLKGNLPTLFAAAQARCEGTPPGATFEDRGDRVEVWDADDFDPWEDLRWPTVRIFRYRQTHPAGAVIHAYCVTDLSARQVSGPTLYRLAKGRWTIENQGFNDGKSRYGLDHVPHHEANSLLIHWLLVLLDPLIGQLVQPIGISISAKRPGAAAATDAPMSGGGSPFGKRGSCDDAR